LPSAPLTLTDRFRRPRAGRFTYPAAAEELFNGVPLYFNRSLYATNALCRFVQFSQEQPWKIVREVESRSLSVTRQIERNTSASAILRSSGMNFNLSRSQMNLSIYYHKCFTFQQIMYNNEYANKMIFRSCPSDQIEPRSSACRFHFFIPPVPCADRRRAEIDRATKLAADRPLCRPHSLRKHREAPA
jgi:hypothetical protein